jgi:hypothetical protein
VQLATFGSKRRREPATVSGARFTVRRDPRDRSGGSSGWFRILGVWRDVIRNRWRGFVWSVTGTWPDDGPDRWLFA